MEILMNKTKYVVATLSLSFAFGLGSAHAIGLGDALSLSGLGGSSSAKAGANSGDLVVNTSTAIVAFTTAQVELADALGGYAELANLRQQLANMKNGDASGIKDNMETVVKINKDLNDKIDQKIKEGAKLDSTQKKKAAVAMVAYVQGLVSSKRMISSIQDVAKNPLSLGNNAGAAIYMVKELPGIVSNGAGTTSSLFKYLAANGVDTSAAKKAASDMGK
jgi:hypothetical protein